MAESSPHNSKDVIMWNKNNIKKKKKSFESELFWRTPSKLNIISKLFCLCVCTVHNPVRQKNPIKKEVFFLQKSWVWFLLFLVGPTDSQDGSFSPQQSGSPFLDDALSSTSCTSAPMSPNILDLGVDLQVDLENDVPDLKFLDSQGKPNLVLPTLFKRSHFSEHCYAS